MTKFAIKNNVLTFMTILVLAFLGIAGFNNMSRDSMPPFTVRFANVVTSFPGASPDRVEMLVTDKIEKQLQQIAEIDNITSESRTGISIVSLSTTIFTAKWKRLNANYLKAVLCR